MKERASVDPFVLFADMPVNFTFKWHVVKGHTFWGVDISHSLLEGETLKRATVHTLYGKNNNNMQSWEESVTGETFAIRKPFQYLGVKILPQFWNYSLTGPSLNNEGWRLSWGIANKIKWSLEWHAWNDFLFTFAQLKSSKASPFRSVISYTRGWWSAVAQSCYICNCILLFSVIISKNIAKIWLFEHR